ncbi:hypothetical protein [Shewanella marisflavi]|uniref:hypothetical protein n=1 Tax=Shewanella marisflavi TaxID=260364 RepID=UPI003AAABC90
MGIFNKTGRHVLQPCAGEISRLRAESYLSEYLSLFHEVNRDHIELKNELINQRDLIKLYLAHQIDEELIAIQQEWLGTSGIRSLGKEVKKRIDFVAKNKQRVIDYMSETEKNWFTSTDVDFKNYSFAELEDFCECPSRYCIPRSYLNLIYDSYKYKKTIEYPIDVCGLRIVWEQINTLISNFVTVK